MITITRDKIYSSPVSLRDSEPDSKAVKEISVEDLADRLGEEVEFGDDLTFKEVFDIIIFHKDYFNQVFAREMKGLNIDEFIDDYEKDFKVINVNIDFRLRISWQCDVQEQRGVTWFVDYSVFDAFGKLNKSSDTEEYPISVALSSLSEIKDNIIFLDETFEIKKYESYDNDIDSIFKARKPFILYEVISAILRDITHFGAPDDRDDAVKDAVDKSNGFDPEAFEDEESNLMKEINELLESDYNQEDKKSFWDVLYPGSNPTGRSSQDVIDDAIIALSEGADMSLEEQLEEAHKNEEYEKAAKLKRLIERRDGKTGNQG